MRQLRANPTFHVSISTLASEKNVSIYGPKIDELASCRQGSVMHCMVRNVLPAGAAIDVENTTFDPARFRLGAVSSLPY